MTERFKPNTTVAAIIKYKDVYLLVEETDQNKQVFNQPAGHIEPFESIEAAAKREVLEETGLQVNFDYIVGTYYFYSESLKIHFLRFCFFVDLTPHSPTHPTSIPIDKKITQTHWLTKQQLYAQKDKMRSPLVLKCFDDYFAGKNMPLNSLTTNL